MTRRNALTQMVLSGAGLLISFGGYKWLQWQAIPDSTYLDRNKNLIAALAETIIPRTDLPGATDAGVADYILLIMRECAPDKMQNRFINGLKDVQQYSHMRYGRGYELCNPEQQVAILTQFERDARHLPGIAGNLQRRLNGRPFFTLLKELTVEGYCTSKPGATMGLAYLYVPGHYEACTTLEPGQKSWALN